MLVRYPIHGGLLELPVAHGGSTPGTLAGRHFDTPQLVLQVPNDIIEHDATILR